MKDQVEVLAEIGLPDVAAAESELELVVPFTDRRLTQTAIAAASRLGKGLRAVVRLVRIETVPWRCDLDHPPVALDFLRSQLKSYRSALPMQREVRLARGFVEGLMSTLTANSVVVLATKRRWWPTRAERLAAILERAGHRAVLVYSKG